MPTNRSRFSSERIVDGTGVLPSAVAEQLERIMNSPEFNATESQRAFLRYTVETALAGQADQIKGYTIATQVFGRKEDFNQSIDPIVSIQANKLRRALERYYLVTGQNDPIHIDIPKGGYKPLFSKPAAVDREKTDERSQHTRSTQPSSWPTIVVQSFENLTGAKELEYFCVGLATEIALEITRYQEVRVLRQSLESRRQRASDSGARFMLGGSVKKDRNGLKVIVNLADLKTTLQIWGDSYRTDLNPAHMIEIEESIAARAVSKISCEYGIIAKALSLESRRVPPLELKTHQAMLRFYQFLLSFSKETFFGAFEALRQASRNEPESGLVWSMLARLYSINNSLELFNLDTSLEQAIIFAKKGVKFEPSNQRVRSVMAFILLFKNELTAGLAETEKALRLNPNSLIYLENIGYLMTLFGAWHRGPQLIHKAIALNPYYNTNVHYTLWLDWVRQGEYERAYEETLHFAHPILFWNPLLKTAILGLLGRKEEGSQAGRALFACKPDFLERGRILIRNYIKFKNIEAKVIEGLGLAGIDVA